MNELKQEVVNKVSRKLTRYEKLQQFLNDFTKYTVLIVTFPLGIIGAIITKLFGFMDESKLLQRLATVIGVLLTLYAFYWAFGFISALPVASLTGGDVALMLGAIMTPIAGLVVILLRYGKSGDVDTEDKPE